MSEDIVFLPLALVFEQTHSSDTRYAATRSTFIFADTDTEFITTEQFTSNWPSISIKTWSYKTY